MFSVCLTDVRSHFFSHFLHIVSIILMIFDVQMLPKVPENFDVLFSWECAFRLCKVAKCTTVQSTDQYCCSSVG